MTKYNEIRNIEQLSQVKDFSGMRFGPYMPSDIDLVYEFHNRLCILGELKYGNGVLSGGQKIAVEHLCDACRRGGLETYLLVAKHLQASPTPIDVAGATMVEYRYNREWIKVSEEISVRDWTLGIAIKHEIFPPNWEELNEDIENYRRK
jgi:hypothetical protein